MTPAVVDCGVPRLFLARHQGTEEVRRRFVIVTRGLLSSLGLGGQLDHLPGEEVLVLVPVEVQVALEDGTGGLLVDVAQVTVGVVVGAAGVVGPHHVAVVRSHHGVILVVVVRVLGLEGRGAGGGGAEGLVVVVLAHRLVAPVRGLVHRGGDGGVLRPVLVAMASVGFGARLGLKIVERRRVGVGIRRRGMMSRHAVLN